MVKRIILIFVSLLFTFSFLDVVFSASKSKEVTQALDRLEGKKFDNPYMVVQKREHPVTSRYTVTKESAVQKTLDDIEFEIAFKSGYIYGDSTYQIDFPWGNNRGYSELKFPIGNWVMGGTATLGIHPWYVNFEGLTAISEQSSGDMRDRDWINEMMFLFSTTDSDAELELMIFDANLEYDIWRGGDFWEDSSFDNVEGRFSALAGFRYERLQYDIYRIRTNDTGLELFPDTKVLDYEIRYAIPYLGVHSSYSATIPDHDTNFFDRVGLDLKVCFSPQVIATDQDDHLLRHKISEGKTTGFGWLAGLNTFFNTKNNWSCVLGLDYLYIETDGHQDQYWYGDDPVTAITDDTGSRISNINLQITSHQLYWYGALKYKF